MVRKIGVVWAGTKEVEDDDDVEGEDGCGQVPAAQQRGETTGQKDAGGGDGEVRGADVFLKTRPLHTCLHNTLVGVSQYNACVCVCNQPRR